MADLSSIANDIPNEIVPANYPIDPTKFLLLGDLPDNKKFLLPKWSEQERDWMYAVASLKFKTKPQAFSNPVLGTVILPTTSPLVQIKPTGFLIYNTTVNWIEQYAYDNMWTQWNPSYFPLKRLP